MSYKLFLQELSHGTLFFPYWADRGIDTQIEEMEILMGLSPQNVFEWVL